MSTAKHRYLHHLPRPPRLPRRPPATALGTRAPHSIALANRLCAIAAPTVVRAVADGVVLLARQSTHCMTTGRGGRAFEIRLQSETG